MREFTDLFERLSKHNWSCVAIIFATCAVAIIFPIAIGGLHASGDLGVYLSFAQDIRAAISSHDFFPGWANDNLGFGGVGIRFYPPVASYVLALLAMLTNSWYYSIWIYFFGWMMVGCWGVNLFVREWGTPTQGVIAGMLYAIVPFPLAEIYQFSLFAEFAAGSLLPFCFLFVTRICRRQKWSDVIFFAASFSALILTHIPATILTSISLLIYVPFLIEWRFFKKTFLQLATSLAAALLASSFYWIKPVTEINWLAHFNDKFSTGLAGYQNWTFPNSIVGRDVPSYYLPVYRNIDVMIVLTFLLIAPALALLLAGRENTKLETKRILVALTITALFGFFMLSQPSSFIWSTFTLLQKIQFPWRWLAVLSVLGAISFVIAIPRLIQVAAAYRTLVLFGIVGFIGVTLAYDVRQNFMKVNRISPDEFEEVVDARNAPLGTSFEAWWPVWAKEKALETKEEILVGNREVEILEWEREKRRFKIGNGTSATLRVATFYYPYWKASINDSSVEVKPDENGAITIPVGGETSDVYLYFKEPLVNNICLWLSLATWVAFLLILIGLRYTPQNRSQPSTNGEQAFSQ
jgi:hypothetical protein